MYRECVSSADMYPVDTERSPTRMTAERPVVGRLSGRESADGTRYNTVSNNRKLTPKTTAVYAQSATW